MRAMGMLTNDMVTRPADDSSVRAVSMTLLMMASLFMVFIPLSGATVIDTDTRWSGSVTIDDDITVAVGRTLTIEAGTTVTVTGDYQVTVDGAVVIEGQQSSPAVVTNNNNPIGAGSNTGWWDGFIVNSGGTFDASWTTFSRGRTMVGGQGDISMQNVTIETSFVAVDIGNSASLNDISCTSLDFACISVLPGASADITGVAVNLSSNGVEVGGTIDLTGLSVSRSGIALALFDGSDGSVSGIDVDNTTTVVMSRGVNQVTVDDVVVDESGLIVDAIATDGLQISNLAGEGVDNTLIGTSLIDLSLSGFSVNTTGTSAWAVAADNGGTLTLSDFVANGLDNALRITGSGVTTVTDATISASGNILDVSGGGRLIVDNSLFTTTGDFGHISSTDSLWTDSLMSGASSSSGLELTDGKHIFSSSTLSRDYLYSDTSSYGIALTWGEMEVDGLTLSGWSDGVQCRTDCLVSGSSLSASGGGVLDGAGISISGGSVSLDTLSTGSSTNGVHLQQGDFHVGDWQAVGHQEATLLVDGGQTAVVRSLPAYSSNGLWDADGDGHLQFGGASARVDTSSYDEFVESDVTIKDLSGLPVSGVTVTSHGFSEVSDASGEVTLPLLAAGSVVTADDGTYGVVDTLSPPSGEIQLPVIPTSGAWTIPTGVNAVLIGGNYTAPAGGDVTISTAASLTLRDAHLTVPNGEIVVEGSGRLVGDNGSTDAIVRTSGAYAAEGVGGGLTVDNDFHHSCALEEHVWSGVHIKGDFYLESTCRLEIFSGSVAGTIHPSMGGWFSLSNAASIRVLDFGQPLQGATVVVQGNQATTNSEGVAVFSATYRNVTEMSDTSTGILTIFVSSGGHSQMRSWDPTSPASIDVMMSTIPGGYLSEWLRLDSTFNPYYLDDNLTILSTSTLTILPFSSLTVAQDRGISVQGVLEANGAGVTGSDWNGITVAEEGVVRLTSSHYSGGPLTVQEVDSSALLDDMILSNAPIHLGGAGQVEVDNSILRQSDYCITGNGGSLNLTDSELSDCGEVGAMLTQTTITAKDVTLGSGDKVGLHLRGVAGVVDGVEGEAHDGQGSAIHLEMVDESLSLTDLNLSMSSGSPALSAEFSDMVNISDSRIHGAPGIIIDHSTFTLERVDFFGDSTGLALDINGARADTSTVSDCDFDGYETAVHLSGGEGDEQMARPMFINNHYHTTTSFSSDGLGFVSVGETLEGGVEIVGGKEISSEVWNPTTFDTQEVIVSGGASLVLGYDLTITVVGDGALPVGSASVKMQHGPIGDVIAATETTTEAMNGSAAVPLRLKVWTETGSIDVIQVTLTASSSGFIDNSLAYPINEFSNRDITIQLQRNQVPQVTITAPTSGDREVQQGSGLEFTASYFDPDENSGEQATFTWYLRSQGENPPGEEVFTGSEGRIGTFNEVGVYTVTVRVTDAWGGVGEDALSITVVLADADADYIETCPSDGPNPWYDLTEDRLCGPDVYDDDDDNDRIPDERDAFPTDPCAHSDNDMDGLPNSLIPDCETDLIEDDDDDNDGTLDSVDADPLDATIQGAEVGDSGGLLSPAVILPLVLVVVVVLLVFLRASRTDFDNRDDR